MGVTQSDEVSRELKMILKTVIPKRSVLVVDVFIISKRDLSNKAHYKRLCCCLFFFFSYQAANDIVARAIDDGVTIFDTAEVRVSVCVWGGGGGGVNSSALQAVEWCNPSTSCYV